MLRPFLFFLIFLAFFFSNVAADGDCILKVRVPHVDYPPYSVFTSSGEIEGLTIDLTNAIMAEANCQANYIPLPWPRGLISLERGTIDVLPHLSKTQPREEFANFLGPMLIQRVKLIVREDTSLAINSLDDLKKLPEKVGIERGFYYGEAFEAKRAVDSEFANKIQISTSFDTNERMLNAGRISGFFAYELNVIERLSNTDEYSSFKIHPFTLREDKEYFGLSLASENASHHERFVKAFNSMKANGTISEILSRYFNY